MVWYRGTVIAVPVLFPVPRSASMRVLAEEEQENAALIQNRSRRRFSPPVLGKIDVIPEEMEVNPEENA